MAIAEAQLDIWAKQGPTPQFVDTFNSIRTGHCQLCCRCCSMRCPLCSLAFVALRDTKQSCHREQSACHAVALAKAGRVPQKLIRLACGRSLASPGMTIGGLSLLSRFFLGAFF